MYINVNNAIIQVIPRRTDAIKYSMQNMDPIKMTETPQRNADTIILTTTKKRINTIIKRPKKMLQILPKK